MRYQTLGGSGLDVSIVGYGGIKLPKESQETVNEALNGALDLGINFIDTARNYKTSERMIGEAVGHRRDEFCLATKSSQRSADGLRKDLETSLKELGFDRIDLYQLHTVSTDEELRRVMVDGGALEGARKAQAEGLVDHVGVTIHRNLDVMRKAIECGEFETLMICYSVLDAEYVGPEILPLACRHNVGTIIMKALSGGTMVSPGFEEGRRAGDEDPLVTSALRYVLSNENVDTVIPGMRNIHEVRQNVRMARSFEPMTEEQEGELIAMLAEKRGAYRYQQRCLQCGYCLPCPQGIDIPKVMRALMVKENYPDHMKWLAGDLCRELEVPPGKCERCGECAERCPVGLDIPGYMQRACDVLPVEA